MKKITFRIVQDNSLLRRGEEPLSDQMLEHHLQNLPGDLKRFFADMDINVEPERANGEVHISMPVEVAGKDTAHLLGDFLGRLNTSKMGLALGMVKDN